MASIGRSSRSSTTTSIEGSGEPVSLSAALASFSAVWSPRIVTTVNDYDVRVAKVEGEHVWHVHEGTDEFFLVLDGELHIALREPAGERTVVLPKGSAFTVPRGTEHKPYAPGRTEILVLEPTGTLSVGDRHDDVPGHVDVTTGHALL
ncbi:cupin domain-containing protein [Streptomyces sp. SID12488]|uniref:cupin domain-containing protein n=1 Tax=Streptomyces sp. SID12488 TaxID=2706040 RepID=UPI0013DB4231|nr:cupin domain-containing protein [Streptomyces sp. SID12488]NEA62755.1 cupin domain-containing protein [Streptomyces sp. SID12488]